MSMDPPTLAWVTVLVGSSERLVNKSRQQHGKSKVLF